MYLDGCLDKAAMTERGIAATRQFAKRQLTWLRAEREALWLNSQSDDRLDAAIASLRANGFFQAHRLDYVRM
jgi:tRNA dimethylallyltransferase